MGISTIDGIVVLLRRTGVLAVIKVLLILVLFAWLVYMATVEYPTIGIIWGVSAIALCFILCFRTGWSALNRTPPAPNE